MSSISVMMSVSRYTIHDDGAVEVWGHVGDYEVMVVLRIKQAVEECLIDYRWIEWNPEQCTVTQYNAWLKKRRLVRAKYPRVT